MRQWITALGKAYWGWELGLTCNLKKGVMEALPEHVYAPTLLRVPFIPLVEQKNLAVYLRERGRLRPQRLDHARLQLDEIAAVDTVLFTLLGPVRRGLGMFFQVPQ